MGWTREPTHPAGWPGTCDCAAVDAYIAGTDRARDHVNQWERSRRFNAAITRACAQMRAPPRKEKRPGGRSIARFGGPAGNQTPDLFPAKNEIGGSPFSVVSAVSASGPTQGRSGAP